MQLKKLLTNSTDEDVAKLSLPPSLSLPSWQPGLRRASSGTHLSTFCLYDSDYSRPLITRNENVLPHIRTSNGRVRWLTLVIPALWEAKLLGRLRQENCLNPGGGGCSEPRLRHCTLAWVTEQDSISKTNKQTNKKELTTKEMLNIKDDNAKFSYLVPPLSYPTADSHLT
ncbi:hypothetical protein AAY473_021987 [Plecturocebus cupreus]